jgi:hypothetical protein
MSKDYPATKYDHVAMICYGKVYWELNGEQRLEVRDVFAEKNK